MISRPISLLVPSLLLSLAVCVLGVAADSAPVDFATIKGTTRARVVFDEFEGSLGATASGVVKEALDRSGDFVFEPGGSAFHIKGTASGGKIQGSVIDSDGKVLFSETYDNLSLRINALQFADEIQGAIFGRPGIGMTQIAFVSDATGHKEIYMCDADGSNIRQITKDNSTCVSPSLRNDAVFLAFTSYVSGYPDIYMIDLRNNARRRIVNAPGTNGGAAFSPDGERLAMTMSFAGNPELYVTNPGGLGGHRLTRTAWAESSPTWSPDGKRIMFSANRNGKPQLFIVPSQGGEPTAVLTGFQYTTEPNWSPDGHRVAATVRHGGKLSVVITDTAAGLTRVLAEGQDPCWGADARHIIYVQNDTLIMHHVENDSHRTIISNMGHLAEPTWSR
jgi:TolB protein